MKKIALVLLASVSFSYGQIEVSVIEDKMDGTKTIKTTPIKFKTSTSSKRIDLSLLKTGDFYVISLDFFSRYYGGCFSKHDGKMKIKLTNGEVYDFYQLSDTECSDSSNVLYVPVSREDSKLKTFKTSLAENIEDLKTYDWELIRFYKSEGFIELNPCLLYTSPSPRDS